MNGQEGRLRFADAAWSRLVDYICSAQFEVGGFGFVAQHGEDFVVEDVLLVAQYVNEIETTFDSAAIADLLVSLTRVGRSPEGLRLWWHSHAREAPFWSVVDENTIAGLRGAGFVSLVGNQELRFLARYDTAAPRLTRWLWVEPPAGRSARTDCPEATATVEIERLTKYVPYVDRGATT